MGWLSDLYGHTFNAPAVDTDGTHAFANRKIPVERIDFHIKRYRQAILLCTQDDKLDPLLTGLSYWSAMRSAHELE